MSNRAIDIIDLVAKSENAAVEFKRARGGVPADFWPSYSSFANTDGGVIILGVREKDGKREIEGLADTETFFSLVRIGERSGMGLSSLYGTWEKERFAAPSIVESYEPDRTKVMVEFEADDSELGEMIGKVPDVIGKPSEVGVIGPELGEKPSEVGVIDSEVGVIDSEVGVIDSEVKEKIAVSDDVKTESDHVKPVSDDVNRDFDVLMGAYRNDFRDNARRVYYAFAENPEIDFVQMAKRLNISENSIWRAVRALKDVGLLVREGATRGSRWIVRKPRC